MSALARIIHLHHFDIERFLLVADDPVDPGIYYINLKLVILGFEHLADIHSSRRTPNDTQVLAIEAYAGKVPDLSKVQIDAEC